MSDDLVERVARAIAQEASEIVPAADVFSRMARAAIAAMREPTEAMIDYAWKRQWDYSNLTREMTETIWRDMISALMKEDA